MIETLLDRVIIKGDEYKNLVDYLDYHEFDIADEVNDFGELRLLFIKIFKRDPKGY